MSRVSLVLFLLASPVAIAPAQQADSTPGSVRLRVTSTQAGLRNRVSVLVRSRGDSLTIRSPRSLDTLTLPFHSLDRIEMSVGRRPGLLGGGMKGMLVGTGIGALAGLVGGAIWYDKDATCLITCLSRAENALFSAMFVGMGGGVVGFAVGFVMPREEWVRIPPTDLPKTRGAIAGLALRPFSFGLRIGRPVGESASMTNARRSR